MRVHCSRGLRGWPFCSLIHVKPSRYSLIQCVLTAVSVKCHTGWEAVMRVRCSRGLRVSSFHGPMFVRSIDLLALPQVCRQTFVSSCFALNQQFAFIQHERVSCSVAPKSHVLSAKDRRNPALAASNSE